MQPLGILTATVVAITLASALLATTANAQSVEPAFSLGANDGTTWQSNIGFNHAFTDKLGVELSGLYLWTSDVSSRISDEDYENGSITLTIRYDNIGRRDFSRRC